MVTGHPTAASAFPPIADYGFLSDCETATLVAADGSVEWLCLPRFDSPSVFAAILDRGAGRLRFGPERLRAPIARRYLPGTNVIGSDWMGSDGWLAVRDAMLVVPDPEHPADCRARRMLVRVARCLEGEADVSLVCSPRFGYGLTAVEWCLDAGGAAIASSEDVVLRLTTDLDLKLAGADAVAGRVLSEGERCFCCLSWGEEDPPLDAAEAWEAIEVTSRFWRGWIQAGRFPDHQWTGHLQRSALALKGLTYAPTGAMLAAATTSLPETPGGQRNWDYRYTWIRDATFTLWGLHAVGFDHEAHDFMEFIVGLFAAAGPDPQIMFGIGGERDLPERILDHLSGYGGARPVRIGNAAVAQRQNDVYGAFVDSVYVHSKIRDGLPEGMWPVVRDQVEGALAAWREPDRGVWERGAFRQHYDTDALDASTLLVPLVRFLPHDDRRVRTTVLAIATELTENGLVLRYRPEEVDDGVSDEPEGSFTICSFWLVSALSEIGEREQARELCARLLGHAGPLGLYAEEIDARSGAHLGNFPQAFTHLALINAVSHVIAEDLAGERERPSASFSEIRAAGRG